MVDDPDSLPSTCVAQTAVVTTGAGVQDEVPQPTFKQLLQVAVTKGLPFVAFGFFDNIIMVSVLLPATAHSGKGQRGMLTLQVHIYSANMSCTKPVLRSIAHLQMPARECGGAAACGIEAGSAAAAACGCT